MTPNVDNPFVGGGVALMVLGAVMALLRQLPVKAWNWFMRRITVSVTVTDRDPLFEWAKLWLDSLPYAKTAHSITCSLYREQDEEFTASSRMVFTPGHGAHFFRHGHRLIWLEREKLDNKSTVVGVGGTSPHLETMTLTVLGTKQTAIRELVGEIVDFAAKDEKRRVRGYTSSHGWWNRMPIYQPRRLETVDVPREIEQRILAAIDKFLESRAMYSQRGIPYHLNFLFEGLPGTGKTSLASALCGRYGLALHLLNIAGPGMNDDRLVDLMLSLPRRSMVLMEDVDAVVPERKTKPKPVNVAVDSGSPTKEVTEEAQGVTLSGLLNCMDGLTAPDGAIIVMTTNHPELIDPALLRPGRVDMRVNFGPATVEQIERMWVRLLPNSKPNGEVAWMIERNMTAAQVQAELLSGTFGEHV